LALGPEVRHQVAEAAIAITELPGDFRQRLVGHEDGPQGFVLPVQGSRRLQEEVLTGGVIHGGPRGSVTGFSVRPSSDGIRPAKGDDKASGDRE